VLWQARKLVFTSADRSISYYEANRGSYELSGRVYASGTMGVPQSLTLVTNESGGSLIALLQAHRQTAYAFMRMLTPECPFLCCI